MKKELLAAVIILLTLSVAFEPQAYAATQPTAGKPYQLSVNIIPPRLPSDGGTYAAAVVSLEDGSGNPSVALTNITVFLSSSLESVAKIENPILITRGHLYAIANLTTTVTPGTTIITASSAGLQTASQPAITATASGFPYALKVFLAPETVISGPTYRGLVIVELLDQLKFPARAGSNTLVQLSSSNTKVANVSQNSLLIHSGDVVASGNFSTAYIPGHATVTAIASGLLSGSDTVTVTGSSPLFLKVFAQPEKIGLSSTGRLTLGLTDSSGNPASTPADLAINITSNDTAVAKTPSFVIIHAGSSFALSNYTTTTVPGHANLTFSESGLNPASVQISSVAAALTPMEFQVLVGPTRVLADQQGYDAVVVSLLSCSSGTSIAKCNPALAPPDHPITVQVTSSNTQVGSVPSSVTIQPGSGFTALVFTSTFLAGTTIITAFANGFQTGQQSISTFGPVPAQLELQGVPRTLPADGNTYGSLEVLFKDSSGGPAFASSNMVVQLLSSESGVVSVDSSVTIPAGSYFAVANLQTTLLAGLANITAFAAGLSPAVTTVQTRIPAPSSVAAYISPANSLLSSVNPDPILVVQLQDSGGNPAEAGADTLVLVTASNSTVLKTPIALIIPKGVDYVAARLDVLLGGSTTLTAVSPGLVASAVSMNVAGLALTLSLAAFAGPSSASTGSSATILSNSTAKLQVTVTLEGVPVPGVQVSWNSTTGSVSTIANVTDDHGATSTVFIPPSPNSKGYALVMANLSSPDFGTNRAEFVVVYSPPPVKPPRTLADVVFSYLIYILPILAAVIAVAAFITIRKRRRKAREEMEAGFQVLS